MTTLELLEKPVDKPGANLLLMEGALPGGWTPTSVTLPDDLSEQETDGLLLRLLTVGRGHQWWIGDTLNFRQKRFASQKYTFAMLETGFSKGYLANMASVAKRFETSRRREVLPWAYHADVSGLTDEEQNRWLDQCQAENWSRKELRKQLKAAFSGYDPDAQPLEFASDEEDAATESLAIDEAEAGGESADLQAFMQGIPEPLRVDEATMNGLLKALSGTLIPQGTIAAPLQIGEHWWVLLSVHRAGTPQAREDFGLAQRVVPIDAFQGEAFPLATWQQRVAQGVQEKDDYAGLVVRPNLGGGAWVLVNERMQVIHKSAAAEDTPAETEPAAKTTILLTDDFGPLDAPVEGGNVVTRILANDQLEIKPWVRDEWHVHDVRDNNLVGYLHACNAGEGYYLRVEAAVNGGRIRLVNADSFARARYVLANYILEQQHYTRPQPPPSAKDLPAEKTPEHASESATQEATSETQEPQADAGFEQMVDALPDAMAAMGREESEESNVMTLEAVYSSMLAATVQRMDFALADVFQDYPGLLNHVVPDAPEEPPVILTEEAFVAWWQPVILGMARLIANPEGITSTGSSAFVTSGIGEGLRVEGNDLALLAKLAARRRPGQVEPISVQKYLSELIAQKAAQWNVTLEQDEEPVSAPK